MPLPTKAQAVGFFDFFELAELHEPSASPGSVKGSARVRTDPD